MLFSSSFAAHDDGTNFEVINSLSLSLLFVDTPLQYIYIDTCIILYISLFSMHLLKFSLSLILSFNKSLFGFLRDDKRIYSV